LYQAVETAKGSIKVISTLVGKYYGKIQKMNDFLLFGAALGIKRQCF
jgi:hypothetical protein